MHGVFSDEASAFLLLNDELALTEILFKQDGDSSLDKARGEHAHHGLILRAKSRPATPNLSLADLADKLSAVPMIKGTERTGTFELWHRESREMPVGAHFTTYHEESTVTDYGLALGARDERLSSLPESGISLLECLRRLPFMADFLISHNITPAIVRGKVLVNQRVTERFKTIDIIIHPTNGKTLESFYQNISFAASSWERFTVQEMPYGAIIKINIFDDEKFLGRFPPSTQYSDKEVRFYTEYEPLNELGFFYVALYIVGNYARYFPDKWLVDVENANPLALAIEELLVQAEHRVPLLALSELSRSYHIPKA